MEQRPAGATEDEHVLYLMRHAKAEVLRPGEDDSQRQLIDRGRRQARCVGDWLAEKGARIDRVLCSEAVRARQTLEHLDLSAPTDFTWDLYNAGAERILEQLHEVDESVGTVLVVAHAPGIPALTWDLAEPIISDQDAKATIAHHFPPSTTVRLEFLGRWRDLDLDTARLTHTRICDVA